MNGETFVFLLAVCFSASKSLCSDAAKNTRREEKDYPPIISAVALSRRIDFPSMDLKRKGSLQAVYTVKHLTVN